MPKRPAEMRNHGQVTDLIYMVLPLVHLFFGPRVETEGMEAIFPGEANLDQY